VVVDVNGPGAARHVDRFGLVLALTVTSVGLLSLVDLSEAWSEPTQQVAAVIASTLTALALLMALRAAGVRRRLRRIVEILVLVGLILSSLLILVGDPRSTSETVDNVPPLFPLALSVLAPIVVIRRLLTHRRIRAATLLGAVSVYLLIAVAFFYAFLTVEVMQSGNFFGAVEPTSDLMYFSLSTITTVGYGDLVAASQPGRLLANAEAVVGQLYLVAFVGFLIGILTTQQRREDAEGSQETQP
jgi:hypothetical protein